MQQMRQHSVAQVKTDIQLGSPNLIHKCFTNESWKNYIFRGQRVKDDESQKNSASMGQCTLVSAGLFSLFTVSYVQWYNYAECFHGACKRVRLPRVLNKLFIHELSGLATEYLAVCQVGQSCYNFARYIFHCNKLSECETYHNNSQPFCPMHPFIMSKCHSLFPILSDSNAYSQ